MLRLVAAALLLMPLDVSARNWTIDAAKSSLTFQCSYQGQSFNGKFGKFEAAIAYDPANLAESKFDVTVDLASADTGNSDRDDALTGSDFFDTGKFPKAHFISTEFTKTAGGVQAQGSLTIRGETRPVTLKVGFAESGNSATLDVDITLKRADFGLGTSSDWADVGAEVPVHGHLVMTAK